MKGAYFTTELAAAISADICGRLGRSPSITALAEVAPDGLVAGSETLTRNPLQRHDRG